MLPKGVVIAPGLWGFSLGHVSRTSEMALFPWEGLMCSSMAPSCAGMANSEGEPRRRVRPASFVNEASHCSINTSSLLFLPHSDTSGQLLLSGNLTSQSTKRAVDRSAFATLTTVQNLTWKSVPVKSGGKSVGLGVGFCHGKGKHCTEAKAILSRASNT